MENHMLNSILRDCPELGDAIEIVNFPVGYEICAPQRPLKHVYFPIGGLLSTLVELKTGVSAESLTVGNEGMVGLSVWFGLRESLEQVLQQGSGDVARIAARKFCAAIPHHRATERLLKRFAAYSLRFSSQNMVCNAHHDVTQRLCRWLLTSADRLHGEKINLTHNLLAHMLAVRRQTIGDIACELKAKRLIRYRRGDVQIVDRAKLEAHSCECYGEMKRLYHQLVGAVLPH